MPVTAVFIHRYDELAREEFSIGFFEANFGIEDPQDILKESHTLFDYAKTHSPSLVDDMEKIFQHCGGESHRACYGFVVEEQRGPKFIVEMTRDLAGDLKAQVISMDSA